jgi:hypothetical protein
MRSFRPSAVGTSDGFSGRLNGTPFGGSTMLVAGGGFCVGVSKAALSAAAVDVGDEVEVELEA